MTRDDAEVIKKILATISSEIERLFHCASLAERTIERIVLPPSLTDQDFVALQGLDRLTQGLDDLKTVVDFMRSQETLSNPKLLESLRGLIRLGAIRDTLFGSPPPLSDEADQGEVELF